MKKKIAVFACVLVLISMFTVVCFAEEAAAPATDGTEMLWDLWNLLNPENVDYLGLLSMLIATLATIFRMLGFTSGDVKGGFSETWTMLMNMLKEVITIK